MKKNEVDGSKFLRRVIRNMFIIPVGIIAFLCIILTLLLIDFLNFSEKLSNIIGIVSFLILSGFWILNSIPQYSAYKKAFKKK